MGVYRSDQAQLTFAAEAAQGGDPEMIEGTPATGSTTINSNFNAGSRSITVSSASNFTVGDMVRIGTVDGTEANTYTVHEARRIELIDGTIQDSEGKWYINKDNLIHDLSRELKQDNINFNYTRFDDACND